MKRKSLALAMAFAVALTAAPVNLVGAAEEDILMDAEELGEFSMEEAEPVAEEVADGDVSVTTAEISATETPAGEEAPADGEVSSVAEVPMDVDGIVERIEVADENTVAALEMAAEGESPKPSVTEIALEPGKSYEIAGDEGEYFYFSYTPTEDKEYGIYSTGNSDTYVRLYQEIDQQDTDQSEDIESQMGWECIDQNDDGANNGVNFWLSYRLEAGITYHYRVGAYDDGIFSCQVHFVEKKEVPSAHSFHFVENLTLRECEYVGDVLDISQVYVDYEVDGQKSRLTLGEGVDPFGNVLNRIYMLDASGNNYDLYSTIPVGVYRVYYTVSDCDYESNYTVNVTPVDCSQLPVITVGQSLTLGANTSNFFKFTAPYDKGWYEWISASDDADFLCRIYKETAAGIGEFQWKEEFKYGESYVVYVRAYTDLTGSLVFGHQLAVVSEVPASCLTAGSRTYKCKDEDCTYEFTETIPAIGYHTYGDWSVAQAPTVMAEGVQVRSCTVCGAQETAPVAKLAPTMTLNVESIPLKAGQSTTKVTVSDLAAGDSIVSWTTSNAKVVKVSSTGKITAQKKAGGKKATVTVTLASGLSRSITVKVQKNAVKTSKISNVVKKLTLERGAKYALEPVITPITTKDKISYSSSNKKVATVSKSGVITAKASGKAKITVKSGSKKVTVTVTVPKIQPTGIINVPAEKTLKKGKSTTLKPKFTPGGAEAKITYKSSNKKVATVNAKGKIVAKKKGTAVITVKAGSITTTCTITVK